MIDIIDFRGDLMKIKMNYCKKSNQLCYRNGGDLYLDSDKIVFRRFKTVFEFDTDEVFCRALPGEGFWSAVELFDRKNSYVLLGTRRKCEKINEYITSLRQKN